LLEQFGRTGDAAALREAVEVGRRAVTAAGDWHPDCGHHLANFGFALLLLSVQTGDAAVLTESIEVSRRAVQLTLAGHRDLARRLGNLSLALQDRFQHDGDSQTVGEAVDTARRAVTAADDPVQQPRCLAGLASALLLWSIHTSDTDALANALAESIEASRRAVASVPAGHPVPPGWVFNLSCALGMQFDRTG